MNTVPSGPRAPTARFLGRPVGGRLFGKICGRFQPLSRPFIRGAVSLLCAALSSGCFVFEEPRPQPGSGVRTGVTVPFGEDYGVYLAAPHVGVFACGLLRWTSLDLELGVDFFVLEGDGFEFEGEMLVVRADVELARRDRGRPGAPVPYLSAGPRFLLCTANTYWGGVLQVTPGAGLASGIRSPGGRWDARLTLDSLPWSGNIGALFGASAGWRF